MDCLLALKEPVDTQEREKEVLVFQVCIIYS